MFLTNVPLMFSGACRNAPASFFHINLSSETRNGVGSLILGEIKNYLHLLGSLVPQREYLYRQHTKLYLSSWGIPYFTHLCLPIKTIQILKYTCSDAAPPKQHTNTFTKVCLFFALDFL